jgi:hypothetical protein
MPAKVKFIPEGASAVTPYLIAIKAAEMIEFYKKVFGATETPEAARPVIENWRRAWKELSRASTVCPCGALLFVLPKMR